MADWQKGDLALCVKSGIFTCEHGTGFGGENAPTRGSISVVEHIITDRQDAVRQGLDEDDGCACAVLLFDVVADIGGHAARFVKITPEEADEFDREVIDLMAGKKVPA